MTEDWSLTFLLCLLQAGLACWVVWQLVQRHMEFYGTVQICYGNLVNELQ